METTIIKKQLAYNKAKNNVWKQILLPIEYLAIEVAEEWREEYTNEEILDFFSIITVNNENE